MGNLMSQRQFNRILRNAVLAALPLTAVGCVATEAKPVPENKPAPETKPVPESVKKDPCRMGKITKKSAKESFSSQMKLQEGTLTAEQCIAVCKTQFEKTRIGGTQDLVALESFKGSDCKTVNRPFSTSYFGRGLDNKTPSTLVSCEVEYTAIHSPYTCPKPVAGRLPNGVQLKNGEVATQSSVNILGQYLAGMAAMETAAITAFEYLTRELEAYDAPEALIACAREAVVEETRHAEMTGLLSASYGAEVSEVQVDDFCLRSLYEIALENAVEGCVNETFAAACGLWQSESAELEVFRQVIAHITEEEMGHAKLSWDIHQWVMPQLSEREQEQIRVAQIEAIEHLVVDFKQESNPELQKAFGLPTRDDAARLFTQLKESVWEVINPSLLNQALTQA